MSASSPLAPAQGAAADRAHCVAAGAQAYGPHASGTELATQFPHMVAAKTLPRFAAVSDIADDRHMLVVGDPDVIGEPVRQGLRRQHWRVTVGQRIEDVPLLAAIGALDVIVVHLGSGVGNQVDAVSRLRRGVGAVPVAVVLGRSRVPGSSAPRILWYARGPVPEAVERAVHEACRGAPVPTRRRRRGAATTPVLHVT